MFVYSLTAELFSRVLISCVLDTSACFLYLFLILLQIFLLARKFISLAWFDYIVN